MHTQLDREDETFVREEHWTYLVEAVDTDGIAHLTGKLSAFGLTKINPSESLKAIHTEGVEKSEKARLAKETVQIQLSTEGRLVRLDGLGFHDSLPHRLLALQLPVGAISPGENWANPALARPYANLLPAESVVSVEGTETYKGLHHYRGDIQALIESHGEVTATTEQGSSSILLHGSTWWDPDPGVLAWRALEGALVQSDNAKTGQIRIQIELLDGSQTH